MYVHERHVLRVGAQELRQALIEPTDDPLDARVGEGRLSAAVERTGSVIRLPPSKRRLVRAARQPLAFAIDDICASECARRLLRWVMHRVHGAVTRETRALAGARSAV